MFRPISFPSVTVKVMLIKPKIIYATYLCIKRFLYICMCMFHKNTWSLIVYSQSFNIKYIKGPYEEVEVYFPLIVKIHVIKKNPSISATLWKNYILFDTTTSIAFKIMFLILQKLQYIRRKYLCKYKSLMYIYCDANMTEVKGRVERSILHGKETA